MSISKKLKGTIASALGINRQLQVGPRARFYRHRLRLQAGDSLSIGSDSIIEATIRSDRPGAEISIGDRTFIGKSNIIVAQRITIGSDVLIAWGTTIVDHDSHSLSYSCRSNDVINWAGGEKDWKDVSIKPVTISDKVWIGFSASILKGVCVGEGAVIAANSVVTRDVEPWMIVAGNPARVVGQAKR